MYDALGYPLSCGFDTLWDKLASKETFTKSIHIDKSPSGS
jgi:hypothetical protein